MVSLLKPSRAARLKSRLLPHKQELLSRSARISEA